MTMALTSRQKMGAAALIMAFSVLVSRFMGLFRDKIISWQFGAGGEADIYFAAFVVPDFLNYLLAGGYVSITLIPLLSRRFEESEEDAWRFFGTVFCWATLAIGLLTALAWVAAPVLAPLVAPGFDAVQCARLTEFLRIVLPAQVFFLPGACLSAILYIRHQFFVPALMPLIYNGGILLFGVGLPWLGLVQGMEGFCWGVLAGAAVGAFLLPLTTVKAGGFSFLPGLRHPLMKKFLLMALPLMIGQSVVVLDEPTSALDAIAEQKLYESFDQMIGEKSAVYISHRLASTRFCDRIAMFEGGAIIELGTHDELMEKDGAYAHMFEVQAQYYQENAGEEAEENG